MIEKLFEMFTAMGSEWVLWLLIALSVASLGIILERFRTLRTQERIGAQLWKEQIDPSMKSGEFRKLLDNASELDQKYPCLESGLLRTLTATQAPDDKKDLELLMASFLGRKKVDLDHHLNFLGTLGSNAPFIGLFGTVLGIIKAFHDLGDQAMSGGAQSVSVGLSEALVATAVGLMVAIPAVIAYNFFQRRIKMMVSRAESLGNFIISSK